MAFVAVNIPRGTVRRQMCPRLILINTADNQPESSVLAATVQAQLLPPASAHKWFNPSSWQQRGGMWNAEKL